MLRRPRLPRRAGRALTRGLAVGTTRGRRLPGRQRYVHGLFGTRRVFHQAEGRGHRKGFRSPDVSQENVATSAGARASKTGVVHNGQQLLAGSAEGRPDPRFGRSPENGPRRGPIHFRQDVVSVDYFPADLTIPSRQNQPHVPPIKSRRFLSVPVTDSRDRNWSNTPQPATPHTATTHAAPHTANQTPSEPHGDCAETKPRGWWR